MSVQISARNLSGFLVENMARDHRWKSDEPIDLGGSDLAPKPTELLLSSLSSCMLITLRMYAERKGWDLNETEVHLKILDSADDNTTHIEKRLVLKGSLSEEQKQRLLDISGRCPVARMLADSVKFVIV